MESDEEIKKNFTIFAKEFVVGFERELNIFQEVCNRKEPDLKQSCFLKNMVSQPVVEKIKKTINTTSKIAKVPLINAKEAGNLATTTIQQYINNRNYPKVKDFVGSCKFLLRQMDKYESDYKLKFRRTLIEGCFDVFYSYEMQMSILNSKLGQTTALEKLATDSMIRSINYLRMKQNLKIGESIYLGEGESSSELEFEIDGQHVKSNGFFCKPGIRKVENNSITYYKRASSDVDLYGFRRLLPCEDETTDYDRITQLKDKLISYKYLLNYNDKMKYVDHVMEAMNDATNNKSWLVDKNPVLCYSRFNTDKCEEILTLMNKGAVVVLMGIPGIGKTTMAIKFCMKSYKIHKMHVTWINATEDSTIMESIRKWCRKLSITEDEEFDTTHDLIVKINDHFMHDSCLFVFDDAKDLASIEKYLIQSPNYKSNYLITSRNMIEKDWNSETINIQLVKLKDYDNSESMQYLKKILKISDYSKEECLKNMCEKLENYPIALKLAASDYNEIKSEKKKMGLEYNLETYVESLSPNFNKEIEEKLMLMLKRIEKENPWGKKALEMFDEMSYLSCQEIDLDIFKETDLMDIISCLEKNAMAELNCGILSSHKLLHEVNRKRLPEEKKKEILKKFLRQFIKIITEMDGLFEKSNDSKEVDIENKSKNKKEDEFTIDQKLSKYIPHIVSLWNYAIKYEELVEEFIVTDIIGMKPHLSYFHLILGYSNYDIAETLVSKIPKKTRQNIVNMKSHLTKKSSLHYAAESGCKNKVALLLANKAVVNSKSKFKHTPLHLAAKNGYVSILNKLLDEKDIDVNCATTHAYTPLHFAAKKGNVEIIEKLINSGANVNAETKYKFSPLHLSSVSGHLNAVKALLKNEKINVNSITNFDETSLFLAVKKEHAAIVETLLIYEADPNMGVKKKPSENVEANIIHTPLHEAVAKKNLNIVKILLTDKNMKLDHKTNNEYLLKLAYKSGSKEIVDEINKRIKSIKKNNE